MGEDEILALVFGSFKEEVEIDADLIGVSDDVQNSHSIHIEHLVPKKGFAFEFDDNIEILKETGAKKIEEEDHAPLGHDGYSSDVSQMNVGEKVHNELTRIKSNISYLYSAFLSGRHKDNITDFLLHIAIVNLDFNLLKKEVAEYYRKLGGNESALSLDFSSTKMYEAKARDLAHLIPQWVELISSKPMIDGILRWRLVIGGEKRFNSKLLLDVDIFYKFINNIKPNNREFILEFEKIRIYCMQISNIVKSLYQNTLDDVLYEYELLNLN